MSFIIGGLLASVVSGAMYLYRETLMNYLYAKPELEPIYDVSRKFRSLGGYVLELGIKNGQFFRLIEDGDSIMIPSRKLLECISHDENKIEYKFEVGYTVTFLNHAHHMIILVKYENLVIVDLMIDKEQDENIYKKIDKDSLELDHLESFFTNGM
jgi:hypothetical protein